MVSLRRLHHLSWTAQLPGYLTARADKTSEGPITSLSVPGNTIVVLHDFDSAFEVLEKKCGYSSNRPELTMAFDLYVLSPGQIHQQD